MKTNLIFLSTLLVVSTSLINGMNRNCFKKPTRTASIHDLIKHGKNLTVPVRHCNLYGDCRSIQVEIINTDELKKPVKNKSVANLSKVQPHITQNL